ncbi:hypothetical protein Tco_1133507 [Tanacetum coccineum]
MNISDIQKNLYNTLIESYNSDKDLFASYGDVVTLKRGRDDQDKDEEPSAGSNKGRSEGDQARKSHQKKQLKRSPSLQVLPKVHPDLNQNHQASLLKQRSMECRIQLEEVFKATNDQLDWHNPEGRPYPHDLSKPLPLIQNARDHEVLWFCRRDFKRLRAKTLKICYSSCSIESYQKKINLSRPDSYHSDLRKMTPYTTYRNIQGIIYQDDMDINHLMRTDELHNILNEDGNLLEPTSYKRMVELRDLCDSYESNLRKLELHSTFDESDTYVLERFDTSAGNPVKEILLKLNLPDHRSILTDSKEYLKMVMERQSVKVKEIQERCIIKAFQDYQIKKGMSMSVQKSQVHEMAKFTRWRNEIMLG